MNRRHFLAGGSALFGLATLSHGLPALAASPSQRRFIFVFAQGGWDPTRVFVPGFDLGVAMEPAATEAQAGNIAYVDHAARPSVRSFLEKYHGSTTVFNGVMVPSVAHEACTRIAMTGKSDDGRPDWPAVLASVQDETWLLPHLVVDGPSYPGALGAAVARTGQAGQLQALIDGSVQDWSSAGLEGVADSSSRAVDRFLARRAESELAAAQSAVGRARLADFQASVGRLEALRDLNGVVDFGDAARFVGQRRVAVEALSAGSSRCVTLAHGVELGGWDSHANNDATQSLLFEDLFSGLLGLLDDLGAEPGAAGGTLLDETTVVVMSEMGRTPLLNGGGGKDHWPWTSALVIGGGLGGDRVIGQFDSGYQGIGVDPATGEVAEGAQILSAEAFGATLLAASDVDPGDWVPGVQPVTGAFG